MSVAYQHEPDGAAEIVLSRPERLNALRTEDMLRVEELLHRAMSEQARAVLLRAEGTSFSVGRDLRSFEPDEDIEASLREFNRVVKHLHDAPVPTVAAVQGHCLGAGAGLALACDLVLAADSASFGSPFGKLGAVADCGFHWHLTTRLGPQVAKELLLTGRMLSGREAATVGLVARSVNDADLQTAARELAGQLAHGPTRAFGDSLAIVERVAEGATFEAALDLEATAQGRAARSADGAEGTAAFLAKRAPVFTGR
ncbi:enoyl-CoA hydratase-related protein [Streptomyces sp. NPDC051677]|uniref:enoyl-CoA hydratase-related protein n=1 Tax=Streptomyces sp. NPDC051677 TaxID=3365669 RepID=UPI0037D0FD13